MRLRVAIILLSLALLGALTLFFVQSRSIPDLLFHWTGESDTLPQVRGVFQLLSNWTRPQPVTADLVPVAHAGVNPFGINTFLEQEVEPIKRERQVQLISEAGFGWIRQAFPWEDIEIHGKGDFEDRRWEPYRSSWDKYDHIVSLAEQYDLQIIALLKGSPRWARTDQETRWTDAPPADYEDFGDYVYAVVSRYRGRIRYYQLWNEPNLGDEWGGVANAEEYVRLLRIGYQRAKEADPDCVILSGALAATIELDPRSPYGINDFIFLQQMYNAGARDYFDILSIQGYGLWSAAYDRRMRPRVLNFSRPLYVREIMVRNGDAAKPIWISEMNWSAVPADFPDKRYGYVTPEQQARNVVEAYQRAQAEWPWVGVVNYWFFKRATDAEKDQAWYYFRMAEPDFTLMPVYYAVKEYANRPSVMYPGYHQEDHWAITYEGPWETREDAAAVLGSYRVGEDASLSFTFHGTDLALQIGPGADQGTLLVTLDGGPAQEKRWQAGQRVTLARHLSDGQHQVTISTAGGQLPVDGFIVRREPYWWLKWTVGLALMLGLLGWLFRR
ncbi:MAG: hypothetical protein H5T62_14700 [Anaerolineae bacterium]|nr:hypothetical protein [Anaerolineae bacterium]